MFLYLHCKIIKMQVLKNKINHENIQKYLAVWYEVLLVLIYSSIILQGNSSSFRHLHLPHYSCSLPWELKRKVGSWTPDSHQYRGSLQPTASPCAQCTSAVQNIILCRQETTLFNGRNNWWHQRYTWVVLGYTTCGEIFGRCCMDARTWSFWHGILRDD
jgi:hypothetical protein